MKKALITGGANGIGNALATKLQSDYEVHCMDLVPSPVGVSHVADVTSLAAVTSAVSDLDEIELLVLNAGVMRRGTLFESSEDDFDLLFTVNVKGFWTVLKAVADKLAPNAVVLCISSRHASILPNDPALYGVTKVACASIAQIVSQTRPSLTVKTAYLGPVLTAIAREGVTEDEYVKKSQNAITPVECAELLFTFLDSNEKTLTYDFGKYV